MKIKYLTLLLLVLISYSCSTRKKTVDIETSKQSEVSIETDKSEKELILLKKDSTSIAERKETNASIEDLEIIPSKPDSNKKAIIEVVKKLENGIESWIFSGDIDKINLKKTTEVKIEQAKFEAKKTLDSLERVKKDVVNEQKHLSEENVVKKDISSSKIQILSIGIGIFLIILSIVVFKKFVLKK